MQQHVDTFVPLRARWNLAPSALRTVGQNITTIQQPHMIVKFYIPTVTCKKYATTTQAVDDQ